MADKIPGKTANVVGNPAEPPFSIGGATMAGDYSGAHNFLTDPASNAPKTGGRDFTKEKRPQSEAKPEVVPNPQEIPAGGVILKADPGPVSAKVTGTATPPGATRSPFKLKGLYHGTPGPTICSTYDRA